MSDLTAQQRRILIAASFAVGLAFLDETAVVTALRAIQHDFGASNTEVQWVMGAYLLALASFMAAAGRLADLYGRRRMFIIGAALFGAGSIAAAAAPSEELLIAARALQGSGGALLMPMGMANATAALPESRRGWTIGIVSTGATVFLALGPLIGGGLTVLVGWRWIFVVNLPAIAAILTIAVHSFPETRGAQREPLDWPGLALLVSGLVSIVLALLNMRDWGPGAPQTIALIVGGIALLTLFVVVERRTAYPLIRLQLLGIPAVAGSLSALFAIQFAILGLTVYLTLYLQLALGYSPVAAGALTLPTVVVAPLLAGPVGRMTDVIGTRALTAWSMLLAAVAIAAVWVLADKRNVWMLLPAFLAFGVARPIATVAGSAATVAGIPRDARGLATALITEFRQLGAVFGVAALGLVLSTIETSRRNRLLLGVDASFGNRRREVLDGILSGSTAYQPVFRALSPAARQQAHQAAATSFVSGFRGAMLTAAAVAGLAALASALLLPRGPARDRVHLDVSAEHMREHV